MFWPADAAADPTPEQERAQAYLAAVAFLRQEGAGAWEGDPAQAILLAEALVADARVAGPRSASILSTLTLHALESRARRVRAVAPLLLDVGADVDAIAAVLDRSQPRGLMLSTYSGNGEPQRTQLQLGFPWYGWKDTRVPTALDNALALQALQAGGFTALTGADVQHAVLYLLEFQRSSDGAWGFGRDADFKLGEASGDISVTAEVIRALVLFSDLTFTVDIHADFDLPDGQFAFNQNIGLAIDNGVAFLESPQGAPSTPAEAALRFLALHAAGKPSASGAMDALLAMRVVDGTFGPSAYDNAVAAGGLYLASLSAGFEFNSDDDPTLDPDDTDKDNDGYLNEVDAFELDATEHADLDGDGVGDNADLDDDGDGIPDAEETGFAGDAQESQDTDADGLGDTLDADDDGDGLCDVSELLAGLDSKLPDTDGDTFLDLAEYVAGANGADAASTPKPDGDIFPPGAPDGAVDARDALLALRIAQGSATVQGDQEEFDRHADVAPVKGGFPAPDGRFGAADSLVVLRRVTRRLPDWPALAQPFFEEDFSASGAWVGGAVWTQDPDDPGVVVLSAASSLEEIASTASIPVAQLPSAAFTLIAGDVNADVQLGVRFQDISGGDLGFAPLVDVTGPGSFGGLGASLTVPGGAVLFQVVIQLTTGSVALDHLSLRADSGPVGVGAGECI